MILASDSSGKVREGVSEAVVSDESRAITADLSLSLSLSLRMISNLILFFPATFLLAQEGLLCFVLAFLQERSNYFLCCLLHSRAAGVS